MSPQENAHSNNRIRAIFDSLVKCTHSEINLSQANDNYRNLYERMITDSKNEIKFLRDQVASKDTYFHEEIKFLCQQLETSLFKQENSNI